MNPDQRRQVDGELHPAHEVEGAFEQTSTWPSAAGKKDCEAGLRIGPYLLLSELGRGGMGVVYLAVRADEQYEQRVALKLLHRGLDTDSLPRRFRRERQILARLQHPNIANIHDGGSTEDGRPYLVMELVEGLRIDEYCSRRRLQTAERLELVRQVCSAVHYAHQNLVVHRDIKPGNILVTADGIPKLLDFGIAKLLDPDSFPHTVDRTRTGWRPMSPRYASPEQLRGLQITTATDVYLLGLLLHKLVTDRLPTEPATESRPASGAVALKGDLEKIIHLALRDEPKRRYDSVQQFSEDLSRYMAGHPVRARQGSWSYRAGKFLRRHTLGVAVAVVVVVTFLVMVAGFVGALKRQVEKTVVERDRAELERDNAEQVSALLFDLFASFDPGRTQGETVTARELLDRGAERVGRELEGQPLVEASALENIGKVYESLGMYDRAVPVLESALELRRANLGENHAEVAESLSVLGVLCSAMADYPRSETLHREALGMRSKLLGDEHPAVAESLTGLAMALLRQGRYGEAKEHQQKALAIQRKVLDEPSPELARSLINLGHVLYEEGDWQRAEQLAREALAIRRETLGEDHPEVATTLANLAATLKWQGRTDEAEPLFRKALAIRRKVFTEDHPDVASVMSGLGLLLSGKGEYKEAEELLRGALEMRRHLLGDDHVGVAMNLSALASVLRAKGDLEGASQAYRDALEIGRRAVGPGHPGQAFALVGLGEALLALGDARGAEPVLREAYDIRKSTLPETSPHLATAADALGRCLTALEDHKAAEGYLLESRRIRESTR